MPSRYHAGRQSGRGKNPCPGVKTWALHMGPLAFSVRSRTFLPILGSEMAIKRCAIGLRGSGGNRPGICHSGLGRTLTLVRPNASVVGTGGCWVSASVWRLGAWMARATANPAKARAGRVVLAM
jgi:hypothetical protein